MESSESTMQIDSVAAHIKYNHGVTVRVERNLKTFYREYPNRATFSLRLKSELAHNIWGSDYEQGHLLFAHLRARLKSGIRSRFGYHEGYVYFSDLNEFLAALANTPYIKNLRTLCLMEDHIIQAKTNFSHEYPVGLEVVNSLPFDHYRYKVFITTAGSKRRHIGKTNLTAILNLLKSYNGVRFTQQFESHVDYTYIQSSATYFYADNLDWLPLVAIMEPSYIAHIVQYKTQKEINDEIASQTSN